MIGLPISKLKQAPALQDSFRIELLNPNAANATDKSVSDSLGNLRKFLVSGVQVQDGFEWVTKPTVSVNPAGTVISVTASSALWNGSPVSYDADSFTIVLPGTGLQRFNIISATTAGEYILSEGANSSNPVQPPTPTGATFVTLLLVNPDGAVVVEPDQFVRYSNGSFYDADGNVIQVEAAPPYWEGLEKAANDSQTIEQYIDGRIAEVNETPELPAETTWKITPVITLSGTNKEVVNVAYAELLLPDETVRPYPAKSFTRTLPVSPNVRQDAVEALENGTFNMVTGPEGLTTTRPALTAGAIWVADVLFTAIGGKEQTTGKVSSVQVIQDGIPGQIMTGNVKVNLGSVVPQTLTDSSTVTFSGAASSKAVLHAPTQLIVLVFSFTKLGHEYLIRVTQANGLHVVLSPLDGVTFKDIAGNAITSIDLPFGDCRILYEHTSDTERTVQVIDGLDGESTGAVEQGWRLADDITVEVDSNDILTTGAGNLLIGEDSHAFTGNNFGAVNRPAAGFYRVISVVAAYNTTYGATVQLMGGSKDMKDPRRTALPSNVLWIRDVIITSDSVEYGDAGTAFTPITLNQFGTHPAFSTQHALNQWLLTNAYTK